MSGQKLGHRQAGRSRRPSPASRPTTASASSSTTTSWTSSSSPRRRPPRRAGARSSGCATSRPAAAPTSARAGCAAASRSPSISAGTASTAACSSRTVSPTSASPTPTTLTGHAAALRARGVSTTTFGVGNDFDEGLLQAIADAGGGHFYYIADAPQIRDAITSEVGEALEMTARGVVLEVTARDDLRIEAITPHAVSGGGGRTSVALGDLGLRPDRRGRPAPVVPATASSGAKRGHRRPDRPRRRVRGERHGGARAGAPPWTYADDRANDAQPRDPAVDRAVALAVRGPGPPGGGREQPRRRLRAGEPGHGARRRGASAATPGKDAELRELAGVARGRAARVRGPDGGGDAQAGALRERQRPAQPRRDGALATTRPDHARRGLVGAGAAGIVPASAPFIRTCPAAGAQSGGFGCPSKASSSACWPS